MYVRTYVCMYVCTYVRTYVHTYVRTYVLTSQGALWFVLLLCCISCRYHPVSSLRAFTVCQNWQTEINWIVHKWNVLLLPNWESCLWSNCAFFHSRVSLIWGRCQCYQTDAHFICRLACLAGQVLSNVNHLRQLQQSYISRSIEKFRYIYQEHAN